MELPNSVDGAHCGWLDSPRISFSHDFSASRTTSPSTCGVEVPSGGNEDISGEFEFAHEVQVGLRPEQAMIPADELFQGGRLRLLERSFLTEQEAHQWQKPKISTLHACNVATAVPQRRLSTLHHKNFNSDFHSASMSNDVPRRHFLKASISQPSLLSSSFSLPSTPSASTFIQHLKSLNDNLLCDPDNGFVRNTHRPCMSLNSSRCSSPSSSLPHLPTTLPPTRAPSSGHSMLRLNTVGDNPRSVSMSNENSRRQRHKHCVSLGSSRCSSPSHSLSFPSTTPPSPRSRYSDKFKDLFRRRKAYIPTGIEVTLSVLSSSLAATLPSPLLSDPAAPPPSLLSAVIPRDCLASSSATLSLSKSSPWQFSRSNSPREDEDRFMAVSIPTRRSKSAGMGVERVHVHSSPAAEKIRAVQGEVRKTGSFGRDAGRGSFERYSKGSMTSPKDMPCSSVRVTPVLNMPSCISPSLRTAKSKSKANKLRSIFSMKGITPCMIKQIRTQ